MPNRQQQRGGPEDRHDMNGDIFGDVSVERRRRDNFGLIIAIAGLTLTFMVQFGGSIWWGATLSADLRHVTETLQRLEVERYTKSDAARDLQRLDQRDMSFSEQLTELRSRIARVEERTESGRKP